MHRPFSPAGAYYYYYYMNLVTLRKSLEKNDSWEHIDGAAA